MAGILWQLVRERLVLPFLDIELKYIDLALKNRGASETPSRAKRPRRPGRPACRSSVRPSRRTTSGSGKKG
jgi:hypothetical protein